jgi:hypothetical protein
MLLVMFGSPPAPTTLTSITTPKAPAEIKPLFIIENGKITFTVLTIVAARAEPAIVAVELLVVLVLPPSTLTREAAVGHMPV